MTSTTRARSGRRRFELRLGHRHLGGTPDPLHDARPPARRSRALAVRDGPAATIMTLPGHPRRSLTWDPGTELAQHLPDTMATTMAVDLCDPHQPRQRGSEETTNHRLRSPTPQAPTCARRQHWRGVRM